MRRYRNVTLSEREEHPYRPVEFDGDEIPHPVRWETLERKYLVIIKAAEVAAVTGDDRGPMVECIQHPEWGRMTAEKAARMGTSRAVLLDAVREGRVYAGVHWCKAGQRSKFRPHRNRRPRIPLRCVETGKVYPGGASAVAAQLRVVRSAVLHAVAHRTACKGLHFTKAGREGPFVPAEPHRRPVLCVESNRLYPSVTDAAREVDCNKGNLSSAAARGHRAAGLHWRYPDLAAANNGAVIRSNGMALSSVATSAPSAVRANHHSPHTDAATVDRTSLCA